MRTLEDLRQRLASLPEVPEPTSEPMSDLLSVAEEFAKLLRKLGIQQTRSGTDLLGSVKDSMSRLDDVHQAALDARDRAVQAERQAEKLALVLVVHLDLLERAVGVMREAGGMVSWVEQLEKGIDQSLSEASKWGLVAVGQPGDLFDPEVHDSVNQIDRTKHAVVVARHSGGASCSTDVCCAARRSRSVRGRTPDMGTTVGIDLGTTNSAVAVLQGKSPRMVLNETGGNITPSAICGSTQLGRAGRRRGRISEGGIRRRFKRDMGSSPDFSSVIVSLSQRTRPA